MKRPTVSNNIQREREKGVVITVKNDGGRINYPKVE